MADVVFDSGLVPRWARLRPSTSATPVFVDRTGRRRRTVAIVVGCGTVALAGNLALLTTAFTKGVPAARPSVDVTRALASVADVGRPTNIPRR